MNISYDYYRVFYYVAKYKKITQAARTLLINQPNITRTIKMLEDSLGCTLFIRSNRGVTLTPEGEKLYSHIKIAFEQIESAEEEISLNKSLQSGIVSIGTSEIALHCSLLPAIKKFRNLYPGVHIHITNHSTPQAITALESSAVDIAVVTTPIAESEILTSTIIKPIHEVAVCSKKFSRLLKKRVSLKEMSEYPLISLGAHTTAHELYSKYFAENNVHFEPDIEAATADQVLPMIKSDLGVGFVPAEFLKNSQEVEIIDLKESPPERYVCIVKRTDHALSTAAKELEKLILKNKNAEAIL